MNKLNYTKAMVLCWLIPAAAAVLVAAEPQVSTGPAGTDGPLQQSDRANPFENILTQMISEQKDAPGSGDRAESLAAPPLHLQTVILKFLRAKNLKTALDRMSSPYGGIAVDEGTNSLIICDSEENLEKILVEVRKADQTPKQIMIEVVIVDVLLKDDTEIGVDWDILSNERYNLAYRQGMIYPNRLRSTVENATTIGDASAFMTTGLGGEVSVISGTIRNVVNLLQEKRQTEILASPRVLVVSGQQAEIKTVEEIPYQERTDTSGGGQLTSTQFKEVGVRLLVKAVLTEDGKILIEIKPKQSVNTGVSISDVPVVDTREASTTLLIEDGKVVVVGGLRRKETKHTKYQVPLLGDIPLIGLLFSDDRIVVENSELLVLLSPHIEKDEPIGDDAMAKFREITGRPLLSMPADANGAFGQSYD